MGLGPRLAGTIAVALATVAWVAPRPADAASPYIHAHRAGTLQTVAGERIPALPEQTLGSFRRAAARGFVLELDVKLTADRVPVAIHDPTLDRTTNCEGPVAALTAAELRARCEVDLLGTGSVSRPIPAGDRRRAPVPTLAEVLRLARRERAPINLEIKNVPTDGDFDPAVPPGFAGRVAAEIKTSGYPPSWLIVQSFWPANLDVIEADPHFAEAATALLTLPELNEGGPTFADARGYEYVSPAWPVSQAYVSSAHSLGLQVVPWTVNDGGQIQRAARLGVDAVISDDPGLARRRLRAIEPPAPRPAAAPRSRECLPLAAGRLAPPIESFAPGPRTPRVFAMQFKQELRHVRTYEDFARKVECMIREYVKPRLARGRPNIVAFNEDIGLMTLATGSRGAAARRIFADPSTAPSCEAEGVPCGVAAALAAVRAGYGRESALYSTRFPAMPQVGATFVAGTDTFARGWMQLFSDLARRYDVYILGSNNQARFRESRDPAEIAALADPDLPRPDTVFVATDPLVYNEVFMWGPEMVRREGPRPLRNVVVSNRKVPVTPIEELIDVQPAPSAGPDAIENLRPYRVPGTPARIGFATSKPAFEYGHDLGEPPPPAAPCADVSVTYMRCLDRLGTNLVMQDEANPGRWTGPSGEGNWTPLEWMRSTWRAAGDPDVDFDYNVTPHLVGNLADMPFDGQTAITQRGSARRGAGRGCTYVGNRRFMPGPPEGDAAYLRPYAGRKREFLAIVPWAAPDGPRDRLRQTGAALAPGSGHELENDYVESAVIADLPYPVDRSRPRCGRGSVPQPGACANEAVGTFRSDRIDGGGRGDRIRGLRGADRIGGGGGRDCLRGEQGADRLGGGSGNDRLHGGVGADLIRGGPGADRLIGGPGPDLIAGGRGDDRISVRDGDRDRVRCGPGADRVRADPIDRIARDCERVRRG